MTSGRAARRLAGMALRTGERQTEQAGGVPGKDQPHVAVAQPKFTAGLKLDLEVPARKPPRKPRRVGAEDDPLRSHRVQKLRKEGPEIECVRHPPHPFIAARGVHVDVDTSGSNEW